MKIKFRSVRLSNQNKERLDLINSIIGEYQGQGYILTLRQLYYQLVSRDFIPNKQAEYGKLSVLLKEGRMGGIIDWDAIEDRLRQPWSPYYVQNIEHAITDTIDQYRLPRMKDQPVYLEVWVEKDALSGVLKRVTERYNIPLLVNRGYSSTTSMHDAFNRFCSGRKEEVKVLYLGDFDPSGLDMVRDVEERIQEFFDGDDGGGCGGTVMDFTVEHIALTMEQIKQYDPPPNPTKVTDPRAKEFIAKYGSTSWEVDALPPDVLNALLEKEIEENINRDLYNSILKDEKKDKERLEELKDYL